MFVLRSTYAKTRAELNQAYADLDDERMNNVALMRNYRELGEVLRAERQKIQESDGYQQPYRRFVDQLFVNKREGTDGLLHMSAGFSGEAGEVLDEVKKHWVYGKPLNREKVIGEMGDAFYYFTGLMLLLGITLQEVIDPNVTKLKKRYPNGYSDQAAIARADAQ